ncbi:MAG TPA: hypothetical protein VMV94_03220 [Phycisphaerae bacterium]|nr:hypothetical protein [Phycisphaerae bacterium]
MFRGVLVVVMAAVAVLLVLAMVMIASNGPTAVAQQTGPPAAPRSSDAKPRPAEGDLKALARAAEGWVKNNPRGKTEAVEKPVPKDNSHPNVSRAEREALGLPAPTWVARYASKVHPAVNEALAQQHDKIAREEQMIDFQSDRPVGFQGTAYVDLYVTQEPPGGRDGHENHPGLTETQARVLSNLTAGEFRTVFTFERSAGLVGYINDTGLAKVVADPEVIAVGLDDQARPEPAKVVLQAEPEAGGGPGPSSARKLIGKIDAETFDALEKSEDGYVHVLIGLNRPVKWDIPWNEKKTKMREMEDRILSDLTALEFRLCSRGGSMNGYVTAAGLAKLDKHPDVEGVCLDARLRIVR